MLRFLKYHTFLSWFAVLFARLQAIMGNSQKWINIDKFHYLCLKIESKFHVKSSIFLSFIEIPELQIKLRKNSSDIEVFYQVWTQEEYLEPINIIKKNITISEQPIIFDIGANIGMASLYFKNKFSQAKIYSFEPFESNRNQIPKQFIVSPKALWKTDYMLKTSMDFRDGKEWSVQVLEDPNGNIPGAKLSTLMKDFNITSIDILKVDVEGSEYPALLEDNTIEDSLTRVKAIVIEIHDDAGNRNDLYTKLKECHFINYPLGELDVFINEKFIA